MRINKLYIGLVVLITFLAFTPSLNNKFTNWDDDFYVVNNGIIREFSFQNTVKIFTTSYNENYMPLTILSYNLEYTLFKLNPFVYHLNNLLLHLFNCVLVFYFISLLFTNNRIAFVVALLFGVHPMHVESVAWVAERKDVLYSLFYLLSLIFYFKYLKSQKARYFLIALFSFVFSCLSKAMAVTLPFVLLLLDYYAERKFDRKVFLEKIPLFVLSFFFGILGFLMQSNYGAIKIEKLSKYSDNIINAFYAIGFYLYKLIVPVNLANIYSYPSTLLRMLPLIMLFLLAGILAYRAKSKNIYFSSGFFILTILPVLNIIPLGVGVPADRYTYMPAVGLFVLAGLGVEKLYSKIGTVNTKSKLLSLVMVIIILMLSVLTFIRCFAWYDSETIWTDALKKGNNSKIAIYNLTVLSFEKGDYDAALTGFTKAIGLDPGFNLAYNQRAHVYIRLGEFDKARADIAQIEKNNPKAVESCLKLYELCARMEEKERKGISREEAQFVEDGRTFLAQGNYKGAINIYTEALKINPNNPEYLNNRGVASSALNDNLGALKDFDAAIKAMNNEVLPEYLFNRGNTFRKLGEYNEAVADYTRAIKKERGRSEYYNNRGIAYYNLKDYKLALSDFEQAVSLNPGNKSAVKNRNMLLQKK